MNAFHNGVEWCHTVYLSKKCLTLERPLTHAYVTKLKQFLITLLVLNFRNLVLYFQLLRSLFFFFAFDLCQFSANRLSTIIFGRVFFVQLAAATPTASIDDSLQREEETSSTTTAAPSTFKEKVKGFVNSVKEGASDAFESVSDSVSGAAHKLDEKRKEAVAGTKKLVTGAIDKIKNSYDSLKHGKESEESVPRIPESSSEEQTKQMAESVKAHK